MAPRDRFPVPGFSTGCSIPTFSGFQVGSSPRASEKRGDVLQLGFGAELGQKYQPTSWTPLALRWSQEMSVGREQGMERGEDLELY